MEENAKQQLGTTREELINRIGDREILIMDKYKELRLAQEKVSELGDEILDLREANLKDSICLNRMKEEYPQSSSKPAA